MSCLPKYFVSTSIFLMHPLINELLSLLFYIPTKISLLSHTYRNVATISINIWFFCLGNYLMIVSVKTYIDINLFIMYCERQGRGYIFKPQHYIRRMAVLFS